MSAGSSDSGGYASPIDEDEETSQVGDFYRGRSVFITGVTGFVGKVLLEKLLRSCSRVKNVYVLLRPKDGQSARQRLDELLSCQVFSKIKHENSTILSKIVPVSGDISVPELGINQSDLSMLTKHVSVVFHSAATVRFDEPLKYGLEPLVSIHGKLNNDAYYTILDGVVAVSRGGPLQDDKAAMLQGLNGLAFPDLT